jgi:hypothetical protein
MTRFRSLLIRTAATALPPRLFAALFPAEPSVGKEVAAIHATMDALGVPRQRHEQTFTLEERVSLFVDRLSGRLHTQVENNMIYFRLCQEVIVLLEGSPNSSQFRVRQSIEKLRAATTPSTSSLSHERKSSLILPS